MTEYILKEPRLLVKKEAACPEPGETEVLVRVENVGICGSDIHLFHGTYNGPHKYPMLFGHEWSGTVVKTGSLVTGFKQADKVTGDCSMYCDHCESCKTDKNLCLNIEKFGITTDGATAEYIIRDAKYLYKAPENVDTRLLCLSEPIAVAAHLLEKVKLCCGGSFRDKKVLVLGGGVIGMSAMMLLLKMEGCSQVELYDLASSRKALAESVGARIPSAGELDCSNIGSSYAAVYSMAKYDVIIETTGSEQVFVNAMYLVKPGGVLGCVGMIAKAEIPQKIIVTKSLTIVGSIGGTGHFDKAMEFISKYPETASKLISHYYPIEKADDAFKTAGTPEGTMKVVLTL